MIPVEKLQQGFDEARKQIELLLNASDILYEKNQFGISIALSILAREEFAKFTLIQSHISIKKAISEEEWKSISKGFSHGTKLKGPITNAKKATREQGPKIYKWVQENIEKFGYGTLARDYEEAVKIDPVIIKNLELLNEIKKDSLYLDWIDSEWYNLSKIFKNQLKSFAYISKVGTRFLLQSGVFINCQGRILDGEKSKSLIKERVEFHRKSEDLRKLMHSHGFQKKKMVAHSIFKIYSKKKKK